MAATRIGRGRGRNNRAKTKSKAVLTTPSPSSGVATNTAEEVVNVNDTARSMMMTTPLRSLMRIEATIWMNSRGAGTMSPDDFYASARNHEWMVLNKHKATTSSNGTTGTGKDGTKLVGATMVPKHMSKLTREVYESVSQLSEEERLLFDLLVVSTWESNETTNLYPLYRLCASPRGKIQLEVLQRPPSKKAATAVTKTNVKTATRSEILGLGYHHSRKCFSFGSNVGHDMLHSWWETAKSMAQLIIDHRESIVASTKKVKVESRTEKPSFKSLVSNDDHSAVGAGESTNNDEKEMIIDDKHNGEKKTTLEERVRARSLRNPKTVKSKQPSLMGEESPERKDNKTLLALADALRSYSQRRSLGSSGGGGSALDRLKNRSAGGGTGSTPPAKNIARLPVMDMIKDARITWSTVVNESLQQHRVNSGGSKNARGGATRVVSVDLSGVLFQLRLKMVSVPDVSDRRQMELQLLGLLEKLTTLAPDWIHLRKAPSTLTFTDKPGEKKSSDTKGDSGMATNQQGAATIGHKMSIHHSIIVIRNDSVDYATEVRAKLGGRIHNTVGLAAKSINGMRTGPSIGIKRPFQDAEAQQQNKAQRPVGVADALVPPSFRRMYGKALRLDEVSKKKK